MFDSVVEGNFETREDGSVLFYPHGSWSGYAYRLVDPERQKQVRSPMKRFSVVGSVGGGALGGVLPSYLTFEAAGNYTRFYFEGEEPLIHRSLSYLEERLEPERFFRAGRQHILNLDWVRDMNSRPNGKLIAHLPDEKTVELSHRRSRAFREERSL